MERFNAHVQYDDWTGTAAADNHNPLEGLKKHLSERGLIHDNEYLIATSLWVGENDRGELGLVRLHAYAFTGKADYENVRIALDRLAGPVPVRDIKIDLTLNEFFLFFKRFKIMLTHRNLPLADREFIEVS